jgi:phosphoribosylanthranilate isomerase
MAEIMVKICGITTLEDARMAAAAGADMLGLNFYHRSPRYISPADAQAICEPLREEWGEACPLLVGLFVNEVVNGIAAISNQVGLDAVQLSGDESVEILGELEGMAFKSIRPRDAAQALDDVNYYAPRFPANQGLPSLLLDAYHPNLYGGTGDQAGADVIAAVKGRVPRLMLAGGLTPDNVAERVNSVRPWGVDVASGVELKGAPGVKDQAKVQAFIEAAREVVSYG